MRLVAATLCIFLFACEKQPLACPKPPPSAAPSPAAAPQGRPDWPTYHGNYSLDGVAGSTVPDAPERLWKFKAGNRVEATPVSADGRIHFTSVKGGLFAVDLNGSLVWKITIEPDSFTSPPLLAGGKIVVGSGKGFLRAFDAATGGEKWSYDAGGTVQGTANGIDLPGGKKGIFVISQSDGSIHGVDLETGKGAWKTPPMQRCDGSAGVGGGLIVMGSCAAALHVFSVEKAEKTSDVPLGRDNEVAGGVAMSGTLAFAGTRSGKLCAVDVAAGKVVWTNADGQGEAFATPAVSDKAVVFGADDGKLYGLNRATGEKMWVFDSGNRPLSPVIAGDRVVLSSGGSLFLLDLATGRKIWSVAVSDDITSPAVVAGMILVGGDDGTVTAYGRK
jgi:outer membrane protein assembly factor BamB